MALYCRSPVSSSHRVQRAIANARSDHGKEGEVGPPAMYVATFMLFLIPWSILWVAWKGLLKGRKEFTHQDWRSYCLRAALIVATFATLTAMGFFLSWTHGGGSPHGGTPMPGLWLTLRPIAMWSVVATVAIGAFGK